MNHLWNSLKEKAITAITSPNLFWSWQIELRAARLFVFLSASPCGGFLWGYTLASSSRHGFDHDLVLKPMVTTGDGFNPTHGEPC